MKSTLLKILIFLTVLSSIILVKGTFGDELREKAKHLDEQKLNNYGHPFTTKGIYIEAVSVVYNDFKKHYQNYTMDNYLVTFFEESNYYFVQFSIPIIQMSTGGVIQYKLEKSTYQIIDKLVVK